MGKNIRYDRIFSALIVVAVVSFATVNTIISRHENSSSLNTNNSSISDSTGVLETTVPDGNYETITLAYSNIKKGSLVLTNLSNYLGNDDAPNSLVPIYSNKSDCYRVKDLETSLTSSTVKALNNLLTAYNQEHDADEIMVTSGYRTVEQQNAYYQEYLKGTNDVFKGGVFPGGFSDYNTGAGFDLGIFPKSGESSSYYTPDGEYSWIAENASQYGFILRYPADKTGITNHKTLTYHFRYVGFPHSYYMTQNNLCLEEYIEELKQYTATPLKISAFSKDYEIYYIRANENSDTVAYIPKNVSYTVSGNNIDGFILTLERDQ